MKKLIFIFLSLFAVTSYGQTNLSNNLQPNTPKSIDNRQGKFTSGVWRPYTDTAEANASINVFYRYNGLTVQVGTPTSYIDYWYYGGTAGSNLVPKSTGSVPTLLANRAVVSNGSGIITQSVTTALEVSALSGIDSNIQAKFNARPPISSYDSTGDVKVVLDPLSGKYIFRSNMNGKILDWKNLDDADSSTIVTVGMMKKYVQPQLDTLQTQINFLLANTGGTGTLDSPGTLSLTPGAGSGVLTANWGNVLGQTGWVLMYDDNSGFTSPDSIVFTKTSPFTRDITGLADGTMYYAKITATKSGWTRTYSNVATGTPSASAPLAFTGAIDAGQGAIDVSIDGQLSWSVNDLDAIGNTSIGTTSDSLKGSIEFTADVAGNTIVQLASLSGGALTRKAPADFIANDGSFVRHRITNSTVTSVLFEGVAYAAGDVVRFDITSSGVYVYVNGTMQDTGFATVALPCTLYVRSANGASTMSNITIKGSNLIPTDF